jgi:NAD(P)-dependent dehydrogenase (short-subunit alcohol dehydrogenase family)
MAERVVVVTGAFGAFGKVFVDLTVAHGSLVAAIDYSLEKPTEDGTRRLQLGGVDLTSEEQSHRAMAKIVMHFGRIDALVNIAGGFAFETVVDGDFHTWKRLYDLNVITALNASRAAIPHLLKSDTARIVNVGAQAALQARAGMGAYAASKAAVHRLTESIAAESKGKITVNAVLPSVIDTPVNRAESPSADFAKWVSPTELASVITFLCSSEASAVTGALLPVVGRL